MDRTENRRGLTAFQIAKIKPPARGRIYHYDDEEKRLALAVQASGTKSWKFIYNFRDRTRVFSIGKYEDFTVKLARDKASILGGQVADGRDPASERREERNADTFGALAARYLARAKTVNKRSDHPEYLLDTYVLKKWRHRPARAIKRADVRELLEPLVDRWALHNDVRSAVMAVFSYGVDFEVVEANPVRDVKPMETVERERTLSDAELIDVWMALDMVPDPVGRILKIMCLTGQRGNEVRHMRRADIKNGFWGMQGKAIEDWPGTKNRRDHKAWLSAPVRELIGEGAAGAVFPPVSRQRVANAMAKIWKSMNMPRATPHDMRRTFATTAGRLGFPDALIHRVLNHSPGKLRYNQHKYEQESRKLLEAVAVKLLAIISGTDVEADNVVEFRK
jgi:integrase